MADDGERAPAMYRPRRTRRETLGGDIVAELRRYSVLGQHIGHAFAARHGLGPTDLHALIAVMDAERVGEPISPGRLGEQLNLSSGSVTALVDRLERAGHLRRERDSADRRRIHLRYAERGARVAVEFFGPLGRRTDAVLDRFSDEELAVVHRFLRLVADSMHEHRDEIRQIPPG